MVSGVSSQFVVLRAISPSGNGGLGDGGLGELAADTKPQPPAPIRRAFESSRTIQPLSPAPQGIGGKLGAGPITCTYHRTVSALPLGPSCFPVSDPRSYSVR